MLSLSFLNLILSVRLQRFHQRIGLTAFCQVAFVPNRQNAGDHRAWVLQNFVKVQRIDFADQLHQIHARIKGNRFTSTQLEISKGVAGGATVDFLISRWKSSPLGRDPTGGQHPCRYAAMLRPCHASYKLPV